MGCKGGPLGTGECEQVAELAAFFFPFFFFSLRFYRCANIVILSLPPTSCLRGDLWGKYHGCHPRNIIAYGELLRAGVVLYLRPAHMINPTKMYELELELELELCD